LIFSPVVSIGRNGDKTDIDYASEVDWELLFMKKRWLEEANINKKGISGSSRSGRLVCALGLLFILHNPFFAQGVGKKNAQISFFNFRHKIVLDSSDGGLFIDGKREIFVKSANRVIIKVGQGANRDQLFRDVSNDISITELYKASSFEYLLIGFTEGIELQDFMGRLSVREGVQLIQPDLLQKISKSEKPHPFPSVQYPRLPFPIPNAWKKTRGRGIKLVVIDDGFNLNHEAFSKTTLIFGYDVETGTLDPSPKNDLDIHGTRVAGLIFANHQGKGLTGIAPEAELVAIRHTDTWTSNTILSFYLAKLAGADVVNCSWESLFLFEPVEDVIKDLIQTGREGRGTAVVFAAGNGGAFLEGKRTEASIPGVITVGALKRNGSRSEFSNYGNQVDLYTTGEGLLTTDSRGKRKYVRFSGTSASAALISGVIALMLSHNPDLTLQHINQRLAER
jgi:subtilisin